MFERKYFITVNNRTIAENMTIDYALVFVKAIFNEYYNEHELIVAIEEMPRCEMMEDAE